MPGGGVFLARVGGYGAGIGIPVGQHRSAGAALQSLNGAELDSFQLARVKARIRGRFQLNGGNHAAQPHSA